MTSKILDKITELENDPNHTKLNEIQQLAIKIILSSVGSEDWDTFIDYFVDDKNAPIRTAQLARLKLEDEHSKKAYIKQSVAYLIANSTCGGNTGTKLHINIDKILDEKIPYANDLSEEAEKEDSKSQY